MEGHLLHWSHSPEGEPTEGPRAHTPAPWASTLVGSVVLAGVPCHAHPPPAQHSALIRAALSFPALALAGCACLYLLPSRVAQHMHWTRGRHSCECGALVLHGSHATAMQSSPLSPFLQIPCLGARVVSHSPAWGWSWRFPVWRLGREDGAQQLGIRRLRTQQGV